MKIVNRRIKKCIVKKVFKILGRVKHQVAMFLLIFCTVSGIENCYSQTVKSVPSRQSASEAFTRGDFERAFNDYSYLLKTYSKDPLYKYYSGVCLIELERDPEMAVTLLKASVQFSSTVRPIPEDALYYLGRGQQMAGSFTDAINSYNLYSEQVGKKKAKERDVPELIQQCNDSKGKLAVSEAKIDNTKAEVKPEVVLAAPVSEKERGKSPVTKTVNPPKEFISSEYEKILNEAVHFQYKADSLLNLAAEHKKELTLAEDDEKPALKSRITENETMAASYQKAADQKYKEAEVLINPALAASVKSEAAVSVVATKQVSEVKAVDEVLKQNDTVTAMEAQPEIKKSIDTYSFFEILAKPVTDPKQIIEIDPKVPEGLIYRIQIAVFRNPVTPSYFKGITPVYGFKVNGSENKTYYAGLFRRSADARKALDEVKKSGFKDSFVVSFFDSKIISADRAEALEKEWGQRPFISTGLSAPEIPADTIPPTLAYRVEVLRSVKPAKDAVVEGIKVMAGNRGFDILTLDDGKFVYLVGNFITFESAAAYADLLVRNGYRDAHVVAWLGKKEVPIDLARKLFDDIE